MSVVNEKRVALVDVFEVAASLYGRKWSQTTIDLMSEFFHERRENFHRSAKNAL